MLGVQMLRGLLSNNYAELSLSKRVKRTRRNALRLVPKNNYEFEFLLPYPIIPKPQLLHHIPFIYIPQVEEEGLLKRSYHSSQIQITELIPFGNNHNRICASNSLILIVTIYHLVLDRRK